MVRAPDHHLGGPGLDCVMVVTTSFRTAISSAPHSINCVQIHVHSAVNWIFIFVLYSFVTRKFHFHYLTIFLYILDTIMCYNDEYAL